MTIKFNNILIDVDSYKVSMYKQYPEGTEYVSSYIEARKNPWEQVTFFGLRHILEELATPITAEDVDFAKMYWEAQGLPFNYDGWMKIVTRHGGRLPLKIQALAEGTRLKHHNVLVQVTNTDPEFFWLPTWVETKMLRVWYPTTVATLSASIRDKIKEALELTADDPAFELPFKLHDFGARGVSSAESAYVGGAAHLVNFNGTDTGPALLHAMTYYAALMSGTAGSIPAAEHSTITSWGRDNEVKAFKNMLDKFGDGLVAVVSDSYDLFNAVDKLWGVELHTQVTEMEGLLIVRPDSGDPTVIPVETIKRLDAAFGHTVNSKGFKVLNHVRVIQGDGVNYDSIMTIIKNVIEAGYSISNIAFGMGGALLQKVDRDTLGFAQKASAAKINGVWTDVFKDPITDKGKRSKKGRLALIVKDGEYETVLESGLTDYMRYPGVNKLEVVFVDGELGARPQWADIVERARGA